MLLSRSISCLLGVTLAGSALAQEPARWTRHLDPGRGLADSIYALAHGPGRTISAAGSATDSERSHSIVTIRYDCAGERLFWAAYRGNAEEFHNDVGVDVGTDAQGNTYTLGTSWGGLRPEGSEFDYVLIKYSPAGEELWVRRFNGPGNWSDSAEDMVVDSAGNCYIAGFGFFQFDLFDRYATDFHVIKYTSDGDIAWQYNTNNAAGGNLGAGARAIALDPAGNVYATGVINGGDAWNNNDDFLTVKLTNDGQLVYRAQYSTPGFNTGMDDGLKIIADDAGNAYVAGSWMPDDASYRLFDNLTLKYSPTGQLLWTASTSRQNEDRAEGIAVDGAGNVYVAGGWLGPQETNGWVESYSPDGDFRWDYVLDEDGNWDENWFSGIKIGPDGNIWLGADNQRPDDSGYDCTLVKFAPDGTLLERLPIDGGSASEGCFAFEVDPAGNAYMGGYTTFPQTSADFLVIKVFDSDQPTCCPVDYNADGFVDGIDYDSFNNDFEAGNAAADYNHDGFVDGIDYDTFMNAFEAGC